MGAKAAVSKSDLSLTPSCATSNPLANYYWLQVDAADIKRYTVPIYESEVSPPGIRGKFDLFACCLEWPHFILSTLMSRDP